MKIAMIGAGYVGLVSGACFSDFGHDVVCVDLDQTKIDALNKGEIPIFEPGLKDLIASNVTAGRLSFTSDTRAAVVDADVVFIAVGTPARKADGHADMKYIHAAARDIGLALNGYTVVATKSTVPIGTGDEIERIIRDVRPDADVSVVSNPEFLREGAAIRDFKLPDRIVVGMNDDKARPVMSEVYRPLYINSAPLMFTDRLSAELIKYASNAFLATKITFINEMADLCEKTGANVQDVARGMGLDNRIGTKFLHAGPGYGGSCFPKDTVALVKTAHDHDVPTRIVEAVVAVNEQRKRSMGRRVIEACGGSVRGKRIALLGLAFKPNTDDMRDAPSVAIVQALKDGGADVVAFDPEAMHQARAMMLEVSYANNAYECAHEADALVIVTEWEAFRALDLKRIKAALKSPIVVDLRNIYRPDDMAKRGFAYRGIGVKQRAPI
jgi:UDPglucose 6-dehydrogenase